MKVSSKKVSEQIAELLEQQIIDGHIAAGGRLPSERDLATQYQVSRPSVRDAIKQLEAKQLVIRKQGGGTFVSAKLDSPFAAPLFELIANNPESRYDLLEFRFALEGVIAYYAALRGTEEDRRNIESAFEHIEAVQRDADISELARAIVDFYLAIADASHNLMLRHMIRGLSELLVMNVKDNLAVFFKYEDVRRQLSQHRAALKQAIIDGEAERAREANRQHLSFIEKSLLTLDKQINPDKSSIKRLLASQ